MEKYDRGNFDRLREDFSRNTTQETPDLAFLLEEDAKGRINTDMDIQRKYVWNEDREQEMWDSLLLNVRIPEFHAILDGRVRNICDGKQRFTCIFRILRNEISYKRNKARLENQWLFDYAAKTNKHGKKIIPNSIVFTDLPQDIQDDIVTKTVVINRYSGLSRDEEIALFRKINNGMSLSDFARSMASYFYMRKEFTEPLMSTTALTEVINANKINDEDLEAILVRALILCSHPSENVNIEPRNLEHYFSEYKDPNIIANWTKRFVQLLARFPKLVIAFNCRSCRSIMPFVLEGVYRHSELRNEEIGTICALIVNYHAGRSNDLHGTNITTMRSYIENLIQTVMEQAGYNE